MTGERTMAVNRAAAWSALNDPKVLQSSIPGCESVVAIGPNEYDLAMNASIGPVKARFKGRLTLTDVVAPERYTIRFEGKGGQAGFARGEAKVSLDEQGSHRTGLRYAVKAQVGGRLAQVGARLIDAAAVSMVDQFFGNFSSQLTPEPAVEPPKPAKLGIWTVLLAFIRRLVRAGT